MTDTSVATGLRVQEWDDKFFTEYIQHNLFKSDMGTDENSIIHVKENLTRKKGDSITFALVNRLTGAGVTGSSTLEGNAEDMGSRSHKVTVDKIRNGVRVPEVDEQFSAISLRDAARTTLKNWAMEETRDRVISALGSINGVAYGSASEAQKDAWLVDNTDRVIFGDALGNGAGTDHSADLATVTAGMTFNTSIAGLMKRVALTANPKIKPIRVDEAGGKRFFKVYCDPRTFRDLKADSVIQNAQRDVSLRMQNVKLFEGGDLEWDGMIFKEVDDIASLGGVGAASAAVSPVYLVGAQALGLGWAKRWRSITEVFDYGDKHGVAIDAIYGLEKLTFGTGAGDTDDLKDHGVVTAYVGAAADA